jgi:DNA invertase Pin-like site-specific DNA recombinase
MNKKAIGYIRVSTSVQIEGESLTTQNQAIENKAKQNKIDLVKIYRDAGFSGKSIDKRSAFKEMMDEVKNRGVDYLIIYKLSRLGRSCRDLLNTVEILEKHNTTLISIKENIDLTTPLGKLLFQVLSSVAEFERETIREQTLENKIARLQKGVPVSGRLPYARIYDKKTGKWSLDQDKANGIKDAAKRYLNGESARDLAKEIGFSYDFLLFIFKNLCGTKWSVTYKNYDPVFFDIPPLLDEATITKIKNRLKFQSTFNRNDTQEYALSGFIRCMDCTNTLIGQTQKAGGNRKTAYKYYRHDTKYVKKCNEKSFSINLNLIEEFFFDEITTGATVDACARALKRSGVAAVHVFTLARAV